MAFGESHRPDYSNEAFAAFAEKHARIPHDELVSALWRTICELEESETRRKIDPKVGVLNSEAFMELVAQKTSADRRERDPHISHSLIFFDLDDLKNLNTVRSHDTVDKEIFEPIGELLRSSVRSEDIVGRLGGDEFGIFLTETDVSTAEKVVEKLRGSINELGVGVSTGVTEFAQGEVLGDVMRRADDACLYAKYTGDKNNIITWTPGVSAAAEKIRQQQNLE